MIAKYNEIQFSDEDVINQDDWIPAGEYNPNNVRPFLLHDHGFTICVVFADNLQDALNIAADADKLGHYLISEEDAISDYGITTDEPTCAFLGNADEPFDINTLGVIELPNPKASWVAQFNAVQE